tara:strand:+ start:89 stop:565 length:477 start_codon:yes stop_codon:yes gene_type:complete
LKHLSLALFLILLCNCTTQEQFSYTIVRKNYDSFTLTARLNGTFYPKQGGDIDNPYTLFLAIAPSTDDTFSFRNIALYSEKNELLLKKSVPKIGTEIGLHSKRFYFTEFPELMIEYKDYHLKFEVWKNGKHYKELKIIFEKNFSKRLTNDFLEGINSI